MTLPEKPSHFMTRIGGCDGSYDELIFNGVHGKYRLYEGPRTPKTTELFAPSQQQWAIFLAQLNKLKIWNWNEEYKNPWIYDGTFWKIEITWGDIRFVSFGENNYPGKGGLPSNDSEQTGEFKRYLKAVRQLINWIEFG